MATTQVAISPEALKASQHSERDPESPVVVIFGASGDLTKRKLLPALYHLEQAGLLPKEFAIVGVARRPLGDEFAQDMRAGILEFGGVSEGDPHIDDFVKKVHYFAMNFDDGAAYGKLKSELDKVAKEHGIGNNRLF